MLHHHSAVSHRCLRCYAILCRDHAFAMWLYLAAKDANPEPLRSLQVLTSVAYDI